LAIIARMTRSSLLDVLSLDYIRTAHAKGLQRRAVVLKHGLRTPCCPS
jgi:peptide/nickel transport system permease protein